MLKNNDKLCPQHRLQTNCHQTQSSQGRGDVRDEMDLYSTLGAEKLIRYASETCGIPKASLWQTLERLGGVLQIVND